MLFNLLTASSSAQTQTNPMGSWILMAFLLIVIVVFMIFSRRNQKKRQEETQKTLDALKPGNKVKTIGGICGVVVEVCNEDNTFVMETGSETLGKSYIRLDKQAVYQTDAKTEETPVEQAPVEKEPFEEVAEEPANETVEETKTEE